MTRQRANGPGLNRAVARALPVSLEIRALASEENVTVSSGGTTAYYVSPCHRSDPIGCCLDEKWWDKSGGPLADGSRMVNDSVSFLVSFQKVRRIPIAEKKI
jgi:hypothetical protein